MVLSSFGLYAIGDLECFYPDRDVVIPAFKRNLGKVVQVEPMRHVLESPGSLLLKLNYNGPLSSFAFKFNLRSYTWARRGRNTTRRISRTSRTARCCSSRVASRQGPILVHLSAHQSRF